MKKIKTRNVFQGAHRVMAEKGWMALIFYPVQPMIPVKFQTLGLLTKACFGPVTGLRGTMCLKSYAKD
jgi:hypothetical protein